MSRQSCSDDISAVSPETLENDHTGQIAHLVGFAADVAFLFLDGVAAGTGDVEHGLPRGLAAATDDFPALQRPTVISVYGSGEQHFSGSGVGNTKANRSQQSRRCSRIPCACNTL